MSEPSLPVPVLLMFAQLALHAGKHQSAIALAERALEQAEHEGVPARTIHAHYVLGSTLCICRRDREAVRHLSLVVKAAGPDVAGEAVELRGSAYGHLIASCVRSVETDLESCLRLANEAVGWAERIRSVPHLICLLTERGRVHEARRDLNRAIDDQRTSLALRRAHPEAAAYNFPDVAIRLAGYLVQRAGEGDLDEAEELLRESTGHKALTTEVEHRLGRARAALALKKNDLVAAEQELTQALACARQTEGAGPLLVLGDLGEFFVDHGRWAEAERYMREAAAELARAPAAVGEAERFRLLSALIRLRIGQAQRESDGEVPRLRWKAFCDLGRLQRIAERLTRQHDAGWLQKVRELATAVASLDAPIARSA